MDIELLYNDLISLVKSKQLLLQYQEYADKVPARYYLFAIEQNVVYFCWINEEKDVDDYSDFEFNYKASANQPYFVNAKNILDENVSSIFECSHNFCDKTTWWQESIKVEDEVLSGSTTSWQTANFPVIDLVSGKVLYEDDLTESDDSLAALSPYVFQRHPVVEMNWPGGAHYLKPVLKKADGTELTYVSGYPATGEWAINFNTGEVTTGDSLASAPRLSYHYAATSGYTLYVKAGKTLFIDNAEVDVTNAAINSAKLYFDVLIDHPILGNDLLVTRRSYKTVQNIMAACFDAPKVWVDELNRKWEVFNWPYSKPSSNNEDSRIIMKSSMNTRIKMHLRNDKPYEARDTSKLASITTTVYAISKPE